MTDGALGRGALLAVLAAWATSLLLMGSSPDLARDDLCYLSTLHDFLLGYEARKDYSHLGWGLLHSIGHLDLAPQAWRAGRVGATLSWFATSIVPFCAWVAFRVGESVLRDRRAGMLAAALAAWSPAVLLGASSLGFWSRAGAVGLGLLGVAKLFDAVRTGRLRDGAAAVLLHAAGLAVHPWALTAPAIALPLLAWTLWRRRDGWRLAAGVLLLDGALLIGLLALSGQGHRVDAGTSHLLPALGFMPLVAAAHAGWQVPAVGLLLPQLPGATGAVGVLIGVAALVALPRTRPVGLLLAGGLVAALPEAAAPFPPTDWGAAWTDNFIKACVGMELVAVVGFAWLVMQLRGPSRGQVAVAVLLAGAMVGRGVVGLQDRAQVAAEDAAAGRTLSKALAGAASLDERLAVVDSLEPLARASMASKFNPELPHRRRGAGKKGPGGYAGADLALWRVSTMRCELRLGLGVDDGIVPSDPTARHDTACQQVPDPVSAAEARRRRCSLSFQDETVRFACPIGPPHAGPAATRDPASRPLGLAAALLLLAALGASPRREP